MEKYGIKPTKLAVLVYHLTQECNLRCKHCYFYSGTPLKDELSDEEFLDITRMLANLGTQSLNISGGEPLLRRNLLFQIIKEAKKQRVERVRISTNGILLSKEDGEFFKEYDVEVGVSLDGAKAETNDYIRGKGSFDNAINAIMILTETGVHTTIGMTLMGSNLKEAEKMVHLAKELGVLGIDFNQVRIKGRAEKYADTLDVSPKDVREQKNLLRHRLWLITLRTMTKIRIHQLLERNHVNTPELSTLFGVAAKKFLKRLEPPAIDAQLFKRLC